jgi:pentose-5-phosphate-3-epimerase
MDSSLRRVEQARRLIDASGRVLPLQVDGDIRPDNIASVASAGATAFVVGRAIFGQPDYRSAIGALRAAGDAGSALRAAGEAGNALRAAGAPGTGQQAAA